MWKSVEKSAARNHPDTGGVHPTEVGAHATGVPSCVGEQGVVVATTQWGQAPLRP